MTTQSEAIANFDKVDTDTSFFVVDYTTGVPCAGKLTNISMIRILAFNNMRFYKCTLINIMRNRGIEEYHQFYKIAHNKLNLTVSFSSFHFISITNHPHVL